MPDRVLNDLVAMQSMFPDSRSVQNNDDTSPHMNVDSSSSSSTSSTPCTSNVPDTSTNTRKSSRLTRAHNQHYYGMNAMAENENDDYEPPSYKRAVTCRQNRKWLGAIQNELSSLVLNGT